MCGRMNLEVANLTGDKITEHCSEGRNVYNRLISSDNSEANICLDNVEWLTPASIVAFSLAAHDSDKSVDFKQVPDKLETYIDQIKFPDGTEKPENEYKNHLPLCVISADPIPQVSETIGKKLTKLVKEEFENLPPGNAQAISYPMVEMIDNVDQHSGCDIAAVLLQNFPSKGFVDLAIADNGVSIPRKLEENGIKFDTDADAIKKVMNGEESTRSDGYDRGYGIHTSCELVCSGLDGEVAISSRSGRVHRKSEHGCCISNEDTFDDNPWPGTLFVFRFEPPEGDDFQIQEYITS